MRYLVFVLLVICLENCNADGTGCSILGGNLLLKEHDLFEYPEACLRFRCVKGDQFTVSMGCEIRWRGAPTEFYKKEIKQLAEDVKKGQACRKAYVTE